jgi:hypothetical protein
MDMIGTSLQLVVCTGANLDMIAAATRDRNTGKELVPITTFSIAQLNYATDGCLPLLVQGLADLEALKTAIVKGDKSHGTVSIVDTTGDADKHLSDVFLPLLDSFFQAQVTVEVVPEFAQVSPDTDFVAFRPTLHSAEEVQTQLELAEANDAAVSSVYLASMFLEDKPLLQRLLKPWKVDHYFSMDELEDIDQRYKNLS